MSFKSLFRKGWALLRWALYLFAGLIALAIIAYGIQIAIAKKPDEKFILPDGYTGYVVVAYDIPDGQPQEVKDGVNIFRIPDNGVLCLARELQEGWMINQDFEYQDGTKLPYSLANKDTHPSGRNYVGWLGNYADFVAFLVTNSSREENFKKPQVDQVARQKCRQ